MSAVSTSWAALVGDPTPRGWVTLFAYLFAAGLCWRAFAATRALPAPRGEAWFWALLALLFFVLGLNKQLDLQTVLIHIGRALAGGSSRPRGEASVYVMVALAASGAIGLYVLLRLSWPPSPGLALALAGLACLLAFVLMRFSAFQRVPVFVGAQVLRWSWFLELAGIGLAGGGAVLRLRKAPTPG
jgi:hypothetical protein